MGDSERVEVFLKFLRGGRGRERQTRGGLELTDPRVEVGLLSLKGRPFRLECAFLLVSVEYGRGFMATVRTWIMAAF
jgi:hypothetical protein